MKQIKITTSFSETKLGAIKQYLDEDETIESILEERIEQLYEKKSSKRSAEFH